ncbi:glycoside hydrolase family 16 protein [Ceratobasidium sp. AG-Ba]|nr:glycoside hydrolase family 16 protein [Ceratobasidium sp. AG-Ba]
MTRDAEPFRVRNVVLGTALALAARCDALHLNYDPPSPRSAAANMYISLSKPFEALKRAVRGRDRAHEKRRHEGGELDGVTDLAANNDTGNLWVIDSIFEGQNFFDDFDFFDYADPTNGLVDYVDRDTAFREGLAYVTPNNKIVMKVDNTTVLQPGQYRKSVRIQSKKRYNGGLFIIDIERAPHACGAWPAFWTVGPNWPHGGEIDIFEGVHESTKNQATFHTASGCRIENPENFTGNLIAADCSHDHGGMGCGLINDSVASFGAPFNAVGGGVFATRWDSNGVYGWFFHRSTIPRDITSNTPNPLNWGKPTVLLGKESCPPNKYFWDHVIVFDITLCGDLGGPTYADSGCPGTCADVILNPANFYNTSWSINHLYVFRNSKVLGSVPSSARSNSLDMTSMPLLLWTMLFACWFWRSLRTI